MSLDKKFQQILQNYKEMENKLSKVNFDNPKQFAQISKEFSGEVNLGVVFFEDTTINSSGLQRINEMDGMITGSSWNTQILQNAGAKNVETVFQGINTRLFRPLPKQDLYKNKFVIFSGGKLEFRKGQDIVLEAFKKFLEYHDDVILITTWHNPWPETAKSISASPYTNNAPETDSQNNLLISKWISDFGIPDDKFHDLGIIENKFMPQYLREADLAVFPNRCEGGTNLVAMEAMGCGIPCIIAENSGQMDLISDENCYKLTSMKNVNFPAWGTDGWGESSIEELITLMENAYQNRGKAQDIGLSGSEFIHNWSWKNQIGTLLEKIDKF